MTKRNEENEVVLVLSEEEYDYLFKLLLDYGSYAPPETMRTALARKIAKPTIVKDDKIPTLTSWLWSFVSRSNNNKPRWATSEKPNSPLTAA